MCVCSKAFIQILLCGFYCEPVRCEERKSEREIYVCLFKFERLYTCVCVCVYVCLLWAKVESRIDVMKCWIICAWIRHTYSCK